MMEGIISTCYHCQAECQTEVVLNDKVFCCEGCKNVYRILSDNNMGSYYEMEERSASSSKALEGKYNFLDLKEIRAKLILFSENNIARVRLHLPQIHCSSCLYLLERLNKINPAIIQSEVYFNKREAEITFKEDQLTLRKLAELLAFIGYPPEITLKQYDEPAKKRYDKKVVAQIGVVGFCFGNIMLMSFPEYTGIDKAFKNFQHVFNYVNLILSIPVLLFGAREYIVSSFKALRAGSINIDVPITLGIFALYFRSLYEILSDTGAGYLDSFAGLIFFLLIGKWFQRRTYEAINFERDYKSYFPIATCKITDGDEEIVPLKNIKIGDRLLIRSNEMIPADAVLIKGTGRLDYSFVTGESDPVSKYEGEQIFAGGKQIGASIEVEVVKDVENSYLTRLWNNPIFHKKKSSISMSDAISKYFTIAVIAISIIVGAVWLYIDPQRTAFVVTSVLIVACPCALALSIPFTHGNLIRQLGRKSFYLRSTDVIEPVGEITDIVFDKTGTLTRTKDVLIEWEGRELEPIERKAIHGITKSSSHPLSRRIHSFLNIDQPIEVDDFQEFAGKGLSGKFNGDEWQIGSPLWLGIPSVIEQTRVCVVKNNEYVGTFVFKNVYRQGIEELIKSLESDYRIHILSGDNDSEEKRLREMLGDKVEMHFDHSPEDKLNYIGDLQENGKQVMMVGDGLNDAGALKKAEVGFAVVDDVYSFSPSSDGIIDGLKLKSFKRFLDFVGYSKRVVWISYAFSLFYNLIGLYFAVTGQLTPMVAAILMPLSSISVLILVTALINIKGHSIE